MRKLAVIGTVGVPANYGGFETLVENLLPAAAGVTVTVYCSSNAYSEKKNTYKGAVLDYVPLNANGIQSIVYDMVSIIRAIFSRHDCLLILGVSGCLLLPFVKVLRHKLFIVTNIDGLEWKRDKWGRLAKAYLKLSEGLAVRFSDKVVADNQVIANYLFEEYEAPSSVIAYGGDHAVYEGVDLRGTGGFYLALCRVEPENNVQMILESFKSSGEPLVFVGNWAASEYGSSLLSEYSSIDNLDLRNPVYDKKELFDLRRDCVGYLHGHSAGGTNPSLVEMMHFDKIIYCYDCPYNRETTEGQAFYFTSSEDLAEKISAQSEQKAHSRSGVMKEIAERRYTWHVVRRQYYDLFLN